jgi:3-oxoacyl-[acyl-carrier-protein] synthase III
MKIFLSYISSYLPETILNNQSLAIDYQDWIPEKIFQKTGINERRIANQSETALDLSIQSSKKALLFAQSNNLTIDYLIYICQTNDYIFPGNSTLLLNKIGLNGIPSIDVNLACSGYIYGLNLAYSLIKSNQATNILLVTSDTYSKIINRFDKSVRTLFGDGATASIITTTPIQKAMNLEILDFVLGSNGEKSTSLYIKDGGFKFPISPESTIEKQDEKGYIRSDSNLFMDGEAVLNFTLDVVPKNIHQLLQKTSLTIDNIKYFFLHQANKFILEFIAKKMKISQKTIIDLASTGNTTSSSIPIIIAHNFDKLEILPNDYVVLSGFGVGLSWGSALLRKF